MNRRNKDIKAKLERYIAPSYGDLDYLGYAPIIEYPQIVKLKLRHCVFNSHC